MKGNNIKLLLLLMSLSLIILGCSNKKASISADAAKKTGGDIKIAMSAQPPSLDPHMNGTLATRDVTRQIYETLVTINSKREIVPMLAESFDQSADGKTVTFKLRKGVKFHNGKEMTSEDVVASMGRWMQYALSAKTILPGATFTAQDKYTVVLNIPDPSSLTLQALAETSQFPAIMPKETIASATPKGITEYIGTGPFKFVEWKQDQYIHLSKFDGYTPSAQAANGLAGKKEADVDNVYFYIVPDSSTQITGLQTKEYDILLEVPYDNYKQVSTDPSVKTENKKYGPLNIYLNTQKGLANLQMRQAINTALDMKAILVSAFNSPDLYGVDSSYMLKGNQWYSQAGKEFYNQKDLEKAKELLKESGYDGKELKLVTTRSYPHIYNSSVVIQQQLEKIGIKVKLEVYDWPTAWSKFMDPTQWDLFITGSPDVPTPVELGVYTLSSVADPQNKAAYDSLIQAIKKAPTQEEAKAKWAELQKLSWEQLPIIKLGDFNKVSAVKDYVKGYQYFDGPVLWNTKILK